MRVSLAQLVSYSVASFNSGGSHLVVEPAVVAEHDREELRRKALEARKIEGCAQAC